MAEKKYCETIKELREWARGRAIAMGCNLKDEKVKAILQSFDVCFIHGHHSRDNKVAALERELAVVRAERDAAREPLGAADERFVTIIELINGGETDLSKIQNVAKSGRALIAAGRKGEE